MEPASVLKDQEAIDRIAAFVQQKAGIQLGRKHRAMILGDGKPAFIIDLVEITKSQSGVKRSNAERKIA